VVFGGASSILFLFLFWNRSLAKKVRERTSELERSTESLATEVAQRKKTELNYRTVADFTYDWEYWANMDGTLNYVSPSCKRISGDSVQDFMDNVVEDFDQSRCINLAILLDSDCSELTNKSAKSIEYL
jgi:hypothetical protein